METMRRKSIEMAVIEAAAWAAVGLMASFHDKSVSDGRRVTVGMTKHEVATLLGSPGKVPGMLCGFIPETRVWACTDGTCLVDFDHKGKVLGRTLVADNNWIKSTFRRIQCHFGCYPPI